MEKNKMRLSLDDFVFYFCSIALLITTTVIIPLSVFTTQYTITTIEYYEIYRVTCPFGVWHISSEGTALFFLTSFSIDMRESYVIKYFDENRHLKTSILDSREADIVIDGTFRLERVTTTQYYNLLFLFPDILTHEVKWIIHLPYLPKVNNTMTEDWIYP